MDNRPPTPRERIEARREERESRRSFLKHYYYNPWMVWAIILDYLTQVKVEVYRKKPVDRAIELKHSLLRAKFCNGLIGVSLTDTLPALANN